MSVDVQSEVQEPPLTRVDIEYLLKVAGSPANVNLTDSDLSNINLSNLYLERINLTRANLRNADLSGSYLSYSFLGGANLSGAKISHTRLNYANLSHSNLSSADIDGTNLSGANLTSAMLAGTTIKNSDLSNIDLSNTTLIAAFLYNVNLTNVVFDKADLYHASFSNITIDERGLDYLQISPLVLLEKVSIAKELEPIISIRVVQEPLTPQTLALVFTALTELITKFWLTAKHRFADLVEYTQTRDVRFAIAAGTVITRASYNSPFSFDLKVDLTTTSVADATMTLVNGLSQRKAMQEQADIANQAALQKIKDDEQKSELERTRELLAIEREKVALLRETMEVQKLGIEYALDIADTLVDKLHPNVDPETRGMLIRTYLPNILQLDNVRGLELSLPLPQSHDPETEENAGQ